MEHLSGYNFLCTFFLCEMVFERVLIAGMFSSRLWGRSSLWREEETRILFQAGRGYKSPDSSLDTGRDGGTGRGRYKETDRDRQRDRWRATQRGAGWMDEELKNRARHWLRTIQSSASIHQKVTITKQKWSSSLNLGSSQILKGTHVSRSKQRRGPQWWRARSTSCDLSELK